ncbi:MAG: hypothetical protein IT428_05820 [Planctomycetaceae bacterium]|nr:hypothetical protein [Planctomycetaceae bacterium]
MFRNLVLLAVLSLLPGGSGTAFGQPSPAQKPQPVQMPRDSSGAPRPFPTKYEVDKDGDAKHVWLAVEGFQPLALPAPDSPPATTPPSTFMHHLYELTSFQPKGITGRYYLLAGIDNPENRFGWVPEDYLVRGNEALRAESTSIVRKGMIVTRPELAGRADAELHAWTALPGKGTSRGPYRLSNIFFIYGETRPADFKRTGESPSVLIGTETSFSQAMTRSRTSEMEDSNSPEGVVKGWLPANRIAFWNTREAMEWDEPSTIPTAIPRRTTRGAIYRAREEAYSLYSQSGKTTTPPALFEEQFIAEGREAGKTVAFAPFHARYPILQYEGTKEYPQEFKDNRLLKVGGIGGFGGLSAGSVDDLKRQLEIIAERASKMEIMFVIDDTGSMSNHINVVAKTVRQVADGVLVENRGSVRVGVAFYNDTDEQPDGWKPVTVRKLQELTRGDTSFVKYVEDHAKKSSSGGDPPELVFRGLREGVEGAGFSPFARKLVILIGDAGDKIPVSDLPAAVREVTALLTPQKQSPVEFYAIRVEPDDNAVSRSFQAQTDAIADSLNRASESDKSVSRKLAATVSAGDVSLMELLTARYAALGEESREIRKKIDDMRQGQFQTRPGPELESMLKQFGVNLDKLSAIKGNQVFAEGYVWKKSVGQTNIPQVRVRYLLSHGNIQDLIRIMKPLVGHKNDLLTKKPKMKDLLVGVIKQATDDPIEESKSLDEILLKKLGLEARSRLLKMPINSTLPLKASAQDLEEIALRLQKLEDVLEGKTRTWQARVRKEQDQDITWYEGGPASDLPRSWTLPYSQTRLYWIDAEEEIP